MKSEIVILPKEQATRVDRIKAYHAAVQKSFADQMGYAYLAGAELNAAKDDLPHGDFMKWREEHLAEIPHRTATRYMDFQTKLATVANLPAVGATKLLTNGELPEKEREKILKAVHKIADGKTLTNLYRDLGIIRDKEHQAHTPPAELTAEEKVAAEISSVEGHLNRAIEAILIINEIGPLDCGKVPPVKWEALLNASVRLSQICRVWSKPNRKSTKEHSTRNTP